MARPKTKRSTQKKVSVRAGKPARASRGKTKKSPGRRQAATRKGLTAKVDRTSIQRKAYADARSHLTDVDDFAVEEADDAESTGWQGRAPLPSFTIVGIGASAGGLEAISALLRALPLDSGVAIVLVQHLAPKHESVLTRLLAETTRMPVHEITDGQRIEKNHVYIIPPNTQLAIANGQLRLFPRPEDQSRHCPVDFFFRSLADFAQSRAVGIVLSGGDSDGAAGLREIKAAGGIALAQEPRSAKFESMPRSAIATGVVDMVLPPEQIARELKRIAHHPLLAAHFPAKGLDRDFPVAEPEFRAIFQSLRQATGVDFTHYKQPTIRRRLQRRMVLNKINDVAGYIEFIHKNPPEVKSLYEDILIHVTRFFRDPESFEMLTRRVFPQILKSRRGDEPIRIWVPGCATGEESYSVAIAFLEFLGDSASRPPLQVFATDVSENAVAFARSGTYADSITPDVSPERLRRFFSKVDGKYQISKLVRDVCVFARQDLTRDPPFSRLDLILCRNVLIYLGSILQRKLMNVFHYALKPTGFLMLGASETIGPHSDLFSMADKRHRIYSKKINTAHRDLEFPVGDRSRSRADAQPQKLDPHLRAGSTIQGEANRVVLSRYAPPGVIVDEDFQIIQYRGQTGAFLEAPPGEVSLNIFKMAREGLMYDLRKVLNEARKSGATVRRDGLRVKVQRELLHVNIEVIPLSTGEKRHFLVLFETPSATRPVATKARGSAASVKGAAAKAKAMLAGKGDRLRQSQANLSDLQRELVVSREYLQSIIQDLEAANEELQSANEEVLSSNEELQSTNEELDTAKEELQSTNEELNTVNDELQARNEELSRVNSDLVNLLGSVQIAIVMVTSDLRIRRFTPMAEKVLNLIPTDVGRPIGDIKPNINCPDLEALISSVIDTVSVAEREVRDRQGNWFTMRIRPYKNLESRIDGAVVALIESDGAHGRADEANDDDVDRKGNGNGAGDGVKNGEPARVLAPRGPNGK